MNIPGRKKTVVIFLCIALIVLAIFSGSHFHHDKSHDGFGIRCPVCACLNAADHPVEPTGFREAVSFSFIFGALFWLIPIFADNILFLTYATPVSQKTRMNN